MLPFVKEQDLESYEFQMVPFWLRIYNIPIELMDRQIALDVGNSIGELVAIDWKDRYGSWTEFMRLKVKIDVSKPLRRIVKYMDRDGIERIGLLKYERLPDFCHMCGIIGHSLKGCTINVLEGEMSHKNYQFGNWMRAPAVNQNQDKGMRRNGVEVFNLVVIPSVNKDESLTRSSNESWKPSMDGKERIPEEESLSTSPMENRKLKQIKEGNGKSKSKRKRQKSLQDYFTFESPARQVKRRLGGSFSPSEAAVVRELKQLLVANVPGILFLCKTKVHSNEFSRIQSRCRMGGCLAVNSEGKSGGLALMWREDVDVTIQTYSKFHIDSLIKLDNGEVIRFTGFYGHPNPNLRHHAWDMLKKVKDK
ncbi:hypothetical protein Gohar_022187, partial [Gossypium harknessii]|nr:hypothetical protein [Gossypium harknessii]